MKWPIKKLLIIFLLIIQHAAAYNQTTNLSHEFHDSLRNALKDFQQNVFDKKINLAVQQTLGLYSTDTITDTLRSRLLQLLSNDYFLSTNKLQPIPPQLRTKYSGLFKRLLFLLKPMEENILYADISDLEGSLYWWDFRYDTAFILFKKSIEIKRKLLGPQHPALVTSFINLTACNRYAQKPDSILFY